MLGGGNDLQVENWSLSEAWVPHVYKANVLPVARLLACCQQCALLFTLTEPHLTREEDEVTKAGGNQSLYVSYPQVWNCTL